MKKLMILVSMAVLLTTLASCARPQEIHVNAEQMGGEIELKKGDILVVELPANPSTGYAWEVENLDSSIFKLEGEPEYIRANSDEDVVGAGETQVIRIRTIASGKAQLKFIYHRPFEPGVDPLETYFLDVSVK